MNSQLTTHNKHQNLLWSEITYLRFDGDTPTQDFSLPQARWIIGGSTEFKLRGINSLIILLILNIFKEDEKIALFAKMIQSPQQLAFNSPIPNPPKNTSLLDQFVLFES